MVALILCAFATNVRSSRAIERHCRQDVAYRVITGDLVLRSCDDCQVHLSSRAGAGWLVREVLKLCHRAGLVKSGVVSIDGT